MSDTDDIMNAAIPKHVAFIMDGNGRWAKKRHLPKVYGHKKGADSAQKLVIQAFERGIEYISVYAFSSENWSRSDDEVSHIIGLMKFYIKHRAKVLHKHKIRLVIFGAVDRFPDKLVTLVRELEADTAHYEGRQLNVCAGYGGRDEILMATRALAQKVKDGDLSIDEITDDSFSNELYSAGTPDPDLVIRTSGEMRISNFLLWQSAYAEYVFSDKLWPDFKMPDLEEAIITYQDRERRFGGRK